MASIGVVGLNYWGPNLVRNFDDLAELAWLCDLDEERLARLAGRYPQARTTTNLEELLADEAVDA
ncbi:MAG: gfo/Idh/MocA family oxidoreductase, partial [Gaiellaceae bacterium]